MDSYQITFQTYDKVALAYQDKFMDLDLYNDTYDVFCRLLEKPGAKVFEIGCGPGNITRYLVAKRPDFEIEAIDMAPNMLRLAKENNPTVDFKQMDCREIDKIASKYDGIMCGFCMPYLSKDDCVKFIKDSAFLLNSGGVLYFSAIEGDYARSGYEAGSTGDKAYVYYHEEAYLQESLNSNNFALLEVIRKAYTMSDGTASTHIIFLAKKNSIETAYITAGEPETR